MSAGSGARHAIVIAACLVVMPPSVAAARTSPPSAERAQQILEQNRPLAQNGDASAQYNMGVLYDRGYGVPRDYARARQWYEKAAAQHYPRAEHNLGVMYETGKGVARDPGRAAKWFRRGADDGQAASQNNLAVLYMQGKGVAQNTGKAAFWAARAAAGGNSAAIDNLPRIIADLPHIHVNADEVNVRSQPDGQARVVGHVDSDKVAVVLSRGNDWSQILLPEDYTVGWVANALLSGSQAPLAGDNLPARGHDKASKPATHAASKADESRARASNPAASKNGPALRRSAANVTTSGHASENGSQPSADKSSDAAVAESASGPATETKRHKKPKATPDTARSKGSTHKTAKTRHATVSVAVANLRARAGSDSHVVDQLHHGDRVELLDQQQNGWRHVQTSGGMQGWIAGYLLAMP